MKCNILTLHVPPSPTAVDILAFRVILFAARRTGTRHPGIPSLLDIILRDATLYLILTFTSQVCLLLFLLFTAVSDLKYREEAISLCSHAYV